MLLFKRILNLFKKDRIVYLKPKKYILKIVDSNLTNVYEYDEKVTRNSNYSGYYYANYELIDDKFEKCVLYIVHSTSSYITNNSEIVYVEDVASLYNILDGYKVLIPWIMSRITK